MRLRTRTTTHTNYFTNPLPNPFFASLPAIASLVAASADSCTICKAGKYASSTGSTSCSICPSGTYNPDPASDPALHAACEACLPGKWNVDDGTSDLAYDEVGDCLLCDAGKFSDEENGASVWNDCLEGISPARASSCSTCPVGYQCVGGVVVGTCPAGKYSNGLTTGCQECPAKYKCPGGTNHIACTPGSYSASTSQIECASCEAGKFQPDEAKDTCDECTPGHFCPASSSIPISCASGSTFQPDTSAIECELCTNCAPGYEMSQECTLTSDRQCSRCVAGKFSLGANLCQSCQDDEFSNVDRTGCIARCNPGEVPSMYGNGCNRCSKGTFAFYGSGSCQVCDEDGHYTDQAGSPTCKTAPAGHKPTSNRTSIEICPKDTFSIGANTTCTSCPPGSHSLAGASACERCPQYETFNETDSLCVCEESFERINDMCTCKAGETLMGASCQPCERGKWKSGVGVEGCSRCDETLKGSNTEYLGSTLNSTCACPRGFYDGGKGVCSPGEEGMKVDQAGMTLESAELEGGYWRTKSKRKDVRECPNVGACVGGAINADGRASSVCREGHFGPYCDLCLDGFTKDPFLMGKECSNSAMDAVWTVLGILVLVVLVFGLRILLKKKLGRGERSKALWKKTKNGVKIMLASAQITASLPRVVPAISLPKSYQAVVSAVQVTNLNPFTFIPVGCFASGFNFYLQSIGSILPVIAACAILFFLGIAVKSKRQQCFTMGIALTYLTLPAITTTAFALFPCDSFDNGDALLRSDLSINCNGEGRKGWVAFGTLVAPLMFPVGVTLIYTILLYRKRDRLTRKSNGDTDERLEDEEVKGVIFLWETYKPEFYYFEVIETIRRLAMMGFLSMIESGSFTQLTAGLLMATVLTGILSNLHSYQEKRDNRVAILSSALVELTFVSSYLVKSQKLVESGYDATGLGVVLILATFLVALLFAAWAWDAMQDMSRSSNGLASRALKGGIGSSSSK